MSSLRDFVAPHYLKHTIAALLLFGSLLVATANPAISQTSGSWVQIGADIDGGAANDRFGNVVSVSADGTRVAVGAPQNDANGTNAGSVTIFERTNNGWGQLGSVILGEAAFDLSGDAVSLSGDGSRVAIGAPFNSGSGLLAGHVRVFEFNGNDWEQFAPDIDGEADVDQSGESVSLSFDGSIVAVGAIGNDANGSNSGHVRVFQLDDDEWLQLGEDIDGEAANDLSGWSVSLSADGQTVATGAPTNNGNGSNSGQVRVHTFDNDKWVQVGADIDGEAANDNSGQSVSLALGGSRVAIGAPGNSSSGLNAGHVRVLALDGGTWTPIGSDIDGTAGDLAGSSVSLSEDGRTLAVGYPSNDDNGTDSGNVRVFRQDNTGWEQVGADIQGEAADDQSPSSVSLTTDGNILAVGAALNDGTGTDAGHVRVFGEPVPLRCNGLDVTVDLAAGDIPTTGDDVILGTPGDDTINALEGNDTICANDGQDLVIGGPGDDTIFGGPGADTISGNGGNDQLHGEGGPDSIFGGSGNDTVDGGLGNDQALGGSSGSDTVLGGTGRDTLTGGSDNDVLVSGGDGDDAVNGGGGNDADVRGDAGDDTVSGNGGQDTVRGGDGNDQVRGGQNDDMVFGDAGDDFLAGNDGEDTCDGGTTAETNGDTAATNCETVVNVP